MPLWDEDVLLRMGMMKEVFECNTGGSAALYPGVRRAGILLGPVRRPPCASIEVHVVGGGFQSMSLRAVVDCRRVGDDLF